MVSGAMASVPDGPVLLDCPGRRHGTAVGMIPGVRPDSACSAAGQQVSHLITALRTIYRSSTPTAGAAFGTASRGQSLGNDLHAHVSGIVKLSVDGEGNVLRVDFLQNAAETLHFL